MAKGLKPVTGNATGKNLKQSRQDAAAVGGGTKLVRQIMPMDNQALPNEPPRIGRSNPRHINMMFAFGKQSFEGTVGYGPLGKPLPGRYTYNTGKAIIKALGGNRSSGR